MAKSPRPSDPQEMPEEKAHADIRLPKGHALLDSIKNVSLGGRMTAQLTGKVTSGSMGDMMGGGSVCMELEDAKLSSASDDGEDSTMAEDMQNATHRRRASAAEETDEGEQA